MNDIEELKELLKDLQEKISYAGLLISCFLAVVLSYIAMC